MEYECPFCKEIQDNTVNPLNKKRIIFETDFFIVIPTLGCLVVNYLLIIPKKHCTCFGQLDPKEYEELILIIEKLNDHNHKFFQSSTIMFEHGSFLEESNAGNSVYHAHLHVLPFSESLINDLKDDDLNIDEIDSIRELHEISNNSSSYLYYSDVDKKSYTILHSGVKSQYFRRLLSRRLKMSDKWNWRVEPFIENIKRTLSLYKGLELLCS
jgi:diadenosine tetraphosphate (Ap4A) HIT family hydrolase